MLYLLGGFALLSGFLMLVYLFVNADPARLARGLKVTGIVIAVLAVATLAISGRLAALLMPLAVPLIVPGLSVDAWTVAKPLVVLLFLPMAAGIAIKTVAPSLATRLLRIVRPVASAATILLLAAIGVRYFEGFVEAIGSFAIVAQLIYAVGLVVGGHALGAGMPAERRSVLSLGACTRNLGAALAPLLVTPPDPRAMVMVALVVPITLGVTYFAAGWLSKRARQEHS